MQSGSRCKLMSETTHMASQFKDEETGETKFQDVAKVLFSGDTETKNISLNRATITALLMCLVRSRQIGRDTCFPVKPRRCAWAAGW